MNLATRRHIDFKLGELQFDLWRIAEDEFSLFRSSSLPIKEDTQFFLHLALRETFSKEHLELPKVFLALEKLFGKTSNLYDEWKGSFSFPLLLVLQRNQGKFFYLVRFFDHRGSFKFTLYRLLENGVDDYDINIFRSPFELEFSREEINKFFVFICGYLEGYSESVFKRNTPKVFLKKISSNLILYGCRDGELFEEHFESSEEYQQAIAQYEEKYKSTEIETALYEIKSLLKEITDTSS